ncbi:MAG: hypothetical protein AB1941_10715 [Gemmatimonadota bacterium]
MDMVMCVFQAKLGDTDVDQHPEFRPCEIELRRSTGEAVRITADTHGEKLERLLGPLVLKPTSYGSRGGVSVDGVWLGFEFGSDQRLRILDIEPEPPAAS